MSAITRDLFLCRKFLRCGGYPLLNNRLSARVIQQFIFANTSSTDICAACAAAELTLAREGLFTLDGFTVEDNDSMVNSLVFY
jgi:hypothetical protein